MCGIAGIVNLNGSPVNALELKRMTDAIIHRGPDGEGHWLNAIANVGFGHRRLSIIDLSSNGAQPMQYGNGRYSITFNGEIYNYLELKKILIQKGYRFKSDSDTEVLMALYDLKRENCLQDLDGMFAFAIWDEKEQELFCARDRFGEKPFYYYLDNKRFVFASEMKAIWANGIAKSPDDLAFRRYINYNIVSEDGSDKTFYNGLLQLNPSHYLVIKSNNICIKRYYSLDNLEVSTNLSFENAKQDFFELLKNSVRLRLRSDVPVGSSLSGGLDSSSIVKLIDILKGNGAVQKSFTARFKNFDKDEGVFVESVARSCINIQSYFTWPDEDDFFENLTTLCYHQEEPFASSSIYAQFKVMELAAKNNVTVLLDGQGADEQLAGYISYYRSYLNQLFYTNRKEYNQEFNAYNHLHGKLYPLMDMNKEETLRMKVGRIKRKMFGMKMPADTKELKNKLKGDMQTVGLRNLLRYADRNSMAHSREVRLPFLSHQLVEFVFSMPDAFILKNGWTKYVMREAMKEYLPKEIVWRVDKVGYETPQGNWLKKAEIAEKVKEERRYFKDFQNQNVASDWQIIMLGQYYK